MNFKQSVEFGDELETVFKNFMGRTMDKASERILDTSKIYREHGLHYPDIAYFKNDKLVAFFEDKNKTTVYKGKKWKFNAGLSVCEKLDSYRKIEKKYNVPVILVWAVDKNYNELYFKWVGEKPDYTEEKDNAWGHTMNLYFKKNCMKINI